jgi:hypothetical protein
MANFRRKTKTGTHRVKIPGTGWLTVKPGQPVLDHSGVPVDCSPEVFGSEIDNYVQTGGSVAAGKVAVVELPPQAHYVLQKRGSGAYWDVVNPENPAKPINEKALRKAAAEELLEKLLGGDKELLAQLVKPGADAILGALVLICPYEDAEEPGSFSRDFDAFNECEGCELKVECQTASEVARRAGK